MPRYKSVLVSNNADSLYRTANRMVMIVHRSIEKKRSRRILKDLSRAIAVLCCIVIIMKQLSNTLPRRISPSASTTETLTNLSIYDSQNTHLRLNIHNNSTQYIYIDIGCFNGDTIEHFIYFTPNSDLYDIITFEPDPFNYRLCTERLRQEKYKKYNIFIIPKVVWIRNETVLYEVGRGSKSRIHINMFKNVSIAQLEAFDFSSWLSHIIQTNHAEVQIKVSMPGAEVTLLHKMVVDNTLQLVQQWDIEWVDRKNPRHRALRIYVQSMYDSLGYTCDHLIRTPQIREVFNKNGSLHEIKKYYDWTKLEESDTYVHCFERPSVTDAPRTRRPQTKPN